MEVIGNLLDNASKWCSSSVSIKVARIRAGTATHDRHSFTIEDDGQGIAEEQRGSLFQRGKHGDTLTPGHGIGLAVVREIASAYGGDLTVGDSATGGAKIELDL